MGLPIQDESTPTVFERRSRLHSALAMLVLTLSGLFLALANVGDYGSMWMDGPRYANGAAMIHDWLRSGQFLHPLEFAKANYLQYPAFSIPYHPPAYPGLLGLVFLVTG